eukprot:scaffold127215_cov58-Phaeocystis_antarctica.AAC.1
MLPQSKGSEDYLGGITVNGYARAARAEGLADARKECTAKRVVGLLLMYGAMAVVIYLTHLVVTSDEKPGESESDEPLYISSLAVGLIGGAMLCCMCCMGCEMAASSGMVEVIEDAAEMWAGGEDVSGGSGGGRSVGRPAEAAATEAETAVVAVAAPAAVEAVAEGPKVVEKVADQAADQAGDQAGQEEAAKEVEVAKGIMGMGKGIMATGLERIQASILVIYPACFSLFILLGLMQDFKK